VYDNKTNDPVEADIFIEGDINRNSKSSSKGIFSVDELPPGEYTLMVTAEGYLKEIQETEIKRGRTNKIDVSLIPVESSFSGTVIDSQTNEPLSAHIAIIPRIFLTFDTDSTTGTFYTEIDKGSYEVTVSKEGYKALWDSITILPQKTTKRLYKLTKLDKSGRFNGWIFDFDTEKPLSAVIRLDDRTFILNDTLTGEFASMLEVREYLLSIHKNEYSPIEDTIDVKQDSTIDKIYKLRMIREVQEVEKEVIISFNDVLFDFDKYDIKKEFHAELDSLATILRNCDKKIKIKLSGHTCSKGTDNYNLELSRKRAESVKSYLIDKNVAEIHIEAEYYGEAKPKHDNTHEESRKKNRRVEIRN